MNTLSLLNLLKVILIATTLAGLAGCLVMPQPTAQSASILGSSDSLQPAINQSAIAAPIVTTVNAAPPSSAHAPVGKWYCEGYANRNLLGTAVLSVTVAALQFDGATPIWPAASADGLSVRCLSRQTFDGPQNHEFALQANGGLRFFINDQPVLADHWRAGRKDTSVDVALLTREEYLLRLEYYNTSGNPRLSLAHTSNRFTAWRAQYFNEPNRNSTPVRISNDGLPNDNLVLDWGTGGPAGVNADNFSAIWEQRIETRGGTYRFWGDADDELKIYVDGVAGLN
jgi:hypothetical protein